MSEPDQNRSSSHDPLACIQRCETCAQTLNEIAERLSGDAVVQKAIGLAKNALLFIATRRCSEFEGFLDEMSRGLPPEKKAQLKRLGIDLDSGE